MSCFCLKDYTIHILSSWLTDLRVINDSGTFQFGLEKTPTHQTHRVVYPSGIWGPWIPPPPLAVERKNSHTILIKGWHHQSTCICFIPSDYPSVGDYNFLKKIGSSFSPLSFIFSAFVSLDMLQITTEKCSKKEKGQYNMSLFHAAATSDGEESQSIEKL